MRVAVLGATGRTGHALLPELLARGHGVSALVRDPAGLPRVGQVLDAREDGRLRVVAGSATDPTVLERLLEGTDAVMSAIGPTGRQQSLHRDIATALSGAMARSGVPRYVGVSVAALDLPGDVKSRYDRVWSLLTRRLRRDVVADKAEEYAVWTGTDLAWTLVRPPRLTDGAATGVREHHAHRSPRQTLISRGDLAVFLVDVLDRDLYRRQAPFVASA